MTEDGRRESALAEFSLAGEELNIADSLLHNGNNREITGTMHCGECIRRPEGPLRRSPNEGRLDRW